MAIAVCTTFQTLGNLAAMTKRKSALSPSNSMHVPLQTLTPRCSSRRQLAVLHPITSTATTARRFSRFKLPEGWAVEEVPRSDATRVDRYYYEPGTGNKFRSLRAVERYINGEECSPQSRSMMLHHFEHPRHSKMIIYGGKNVPWGSRLHNPINITNISDAQLMRLDGEDFNQGQLAIVASADTSLTTKNAIPDGWVIEKVPRRNSHHIDKESPSKQGQRKILANATVSCICSVPVAQYYYEPRTGRKFRSQIGVLRHITQLREDMPLSAALEEIKENKPLSKAFKLGHHGKNSVLGKKKFSKNNMQSSSFVNPPKNIKWVLASPKGDAWKPFIFETPVPDSVKQQWNQRFKSSMGDEYHNYPCCGAPSAVNLGTKAMHKSNLKKMESAVDQQIIQRNENYRLEYVPLQVAEGDMRSCSGESKRVDLILTVIKTIEVLGNLKRQNRRRSEYLNFHRNAAYDIMLDSYLSYFCS